ncbi:MAG: bifunctional proline dehydrogenase/L-glutamate gamma-semialdehyde dehydrogenase PutA [Gammaproteobacteria bacterium]|nr:bifunctional proline dehydrogenase/L-glutamate gamma-semialdehyde dehydrogenase PutA [Gammaproteobacteria bacterium]
MSTSLAEIDQHYRSDETTCVKKLADSIQLDPNAQTEIEERAKVLVNEIRSHRLKKGGLNAFMAEYDLSNTEGIALMCLAEALLRIPDTLTSDRLIRDKLLHADWRKHLGNSESLFVNALTYGLILTSKILPPDDLNPLKLKNAFQDFCIRHSTGVIRKVIRYAMCVLGNYFVMGENISDAGARALKSEEQGYRYSYDMLGEAARTEADALFYLKKYQESIDSIGKMHPTKTLYDRAGISIKLSALHCRYEYQNRERVFQELYPRVKALCILSKGYDISLTIDAEESDRLILSLEIFQKLAFEPELTEWNGLGLAIQAYQKRTFYTLDFLNDLAKKSHRRLMVRLVKGAYWDTEIKLAQEQGQSDYPVFTRKAYTDISYLACAQKMLNYSDTIYPMFATHNAHTVSTIFTMSQQKNKYRDYEFQCLHGMGDTLYNQIVDPASEIALPCRVYAPVGSHENLLAYLVRRLLENGANSSFVNQILNPAVAVTDLVENPLIIAEKMHYLPHPNIPLPSNIYGEKRMNSKGLDLSHSATLTQVVNELHEASQEKWLALPMLSDKIEFSDEKTTLYNPAQADEIVGHVIEASEKEVEHALTAAVKAFPKWSAKPAAERAAILRRMADLLESNQVQFMAMAIREAGKSIQNAMSEIREAIDFCRYYAEQSEAIFGTKTELKGITGETNSLEWHGRGVFICISPWNFPLAIFLGEVTAALAAGNTVIAKPSKQTPLIATFAVELLHQAGVPRAVIQLLPGSGRVIGAKLVSDPRIAGVIFTGSTDTARFINHSLAEKKGPIVPFIAETGGQNTMVVDSSALPEQVVRDVIASSFDSAGQRCSALRVLFLQHDIADNVLTMLSGAMAELKVGNPMLLQTDVGPVIDKSAQADLLQHIEAMKTHAKILYQTPLGPECAAGYFVPPTLIEIPNIHILTGEVFGPILHVIRFHANQLDEVIDQINSTGYGLTFGIHSRIDTTIDYLKEHVHAGNMYVNRNMIGAVVGVQPFGGEGLSGTGPKAGGPYYLPRLATERVISTNTTASGGNASLMSLGG